MKKFIIIVSLCFSAPAISAENSVRDILNHNTGTVGDVTINQSNSVSNDQLVSEKKINGLIEKAQKISKSGGTKDQINEANQISSFVGIADEINKLNASNQQKNEICKSRAKATAEILGYQLGFIFNKCDEVFILSSN